MTISEIRISFIYILSTYVTWEKKITLASKFLIVTAITRTNIHHTHKYIYIYTLGKFVYNFVKICNKNITIDILLHK